ncbi:MAG: anaerobic sulfatase-maturation protein [Parabacteroides sp.]
MTKEAKNRPSVISPFGKPIYVMLKPVGSVCNLACDYCYYLEKGKFYPEVHNPVMSDELLEKFIREYIECQTMQEVLFTWHGGETLMRPISFYKRALELQRKYAQGHRIDNCIQTNGTLLTDEWCRFFKENNFLVGVSIDGPQEFHDEYRRNRQGLPSFFKVMKGINLLKKHNVEWNGMAVVNDYNVDYPVEFYRFFKEIGCHYIQFAPIVERLGVHADTTRLTLPEEQEEQVALAPFSVDPDKWGDFLCTLFDEWLKEDVGTYYIQLFDSTLANWVGVQPGVCSLARQCGHAGVMEFNGDVYSCDHFVFPAYRLGNIHTHTLTEMMYSPRQLQFGRDKQERLPGCCRQCEYLFACNGECPKNRFLRSPEGEAGLNYLCRGYKKFFAHVAPYMDFMKRELQAERPPANVMEWARTHGPQIGK